MDKAGPYVMRMDWFSRSAKKREESGGMKLGNMLGVLVLRLRFSILPGEDQV